SGSSHGLGARPLPPAWLAVPARAAAHPLLLLAAALGLPLAAAIAFGGLVAFAEADALVIFLSLLACVFIVFDFRTGVVFLILLFPLSASAMFPRSIGGITGLNPINLLIAGTFAASWLRHGAADGRPPLPPAPLVWCYVLPIVLAGLAGSQHLGSVTPELIALIPLDFNSVGNYLLNILVKPLLLVVFALLVAAAAARSRRPERLLVPMLASIAAMCLISIAFAVTSGLSLDQMASSGARMFLSPLGLHANDLGRLYAIAYALMLYTCAATRDNGLRLALVAGMALVVAALVLTFSRGAFFGFVVVNGLFLLSRRNAGTFLLAAAALAGLVLLLPGAVFERVASGWGGGLNALSAGRVDEIWLPLLPELLRSPLIGNGLASIAWSDAMRSGLMQTVGHAHNAYLNLLLDMGLLGLGLIGAYFVHVWRGFRRLAVDPAIAPTLQGFYAGAAAGLISFLLAGFFGSSLTPCLEQIFLWFAIGMMYGQRHAAKNAPAAEAAPC
ncbi:MAG TPA: O-antigen ligase family protein, partial [Azospira sp.]|nr:O-antigen ligase family protein [Azospira sp.]